MTGKFSGKFSAILSHVDTEREEVLRALGDDVIEACLAGRDNASKRLKEFKSSMPAAYRQLKASLAGNLHDWYFAGVSDALEGNKRVEVLSNKAGDHIVVDDEYIVMFKKHDSDRQIKSYPTRAARRFHSGQVMLSGIRMVTLTAGYLFDSDLNEVGAAVISQQRGLRRNPTWCVEIERDAAATQGFRLTAVVEPTLPLIEVTPKRTPAEGTRDL